MRITKEAVPLIENALGIKLFPWQVDYLVKNEPFRVVCPCLIKQFDTKRIREMCMAGFDGKRCRYIGRMNGKTMAYCIENALFDGEPINVRTYASWQRYFFLDIWRKLRDAGFPVRKIKFERTENHA